MVGSFSRLLVVSQGHFGVSVDSISVVMQLSQVEEAVGLYLLLFFNFYFLVLVVDFEDALTERVCRLNELKVVSAIRTIRVLHGRAEEKETKIVEGLNESLIGALLVERVGLIPVSLNAQSQFVADAEIASTSGVAALSGLLEPGCGLLVLPELVEEEAPEGIHALYVAVCCCRLVVAPCCTEVLLHNPIPKLVVLPNLEGGLFECVLLLKVSLVLRLSEVGERKLTVRLAVDALWVNAFLEECADFVDGVWLMLGGVLVIGEGLRGVFLGPDSVLVESSEHHHGFGVVHHRGLLVKLDGRLNVLRLGTDVKELAVGLEAVRLGLLLLLLDLLLRLFPVELGPLDVFLLFILDVHLLLHLVLLLADLQRSLNLQVLAELNLSLLLLLLLLVVHDHLLESVYLVEHHVYLRGSSAESLPVWRLPATVRNLLRGSDGHSGMCVLPLRSSIAFYLVELHDEFQILIQLLPWDDVDLNDLFNVFACHGEHPIEGLVVARSLSGLVASSDTERQLLAGLLNQSHRDALALLGSRLVEIFEAHELVVTPGSTVHWLLPELVLLHIGHRL